MDVPPNFITSRVKPTSTTGLAPALARGRYSQSGSQAQPRLIGRNISWPRAIDVRLSR
jgi:hypothetical protein